MPPPTEGLVAAVVIPTYNRRDRLAALMEGLEAQRIDGAFEVVIVDDASTDGTFEELQRFAERGRVRVRPVRMSQNGGPATARNTGWRATAAPVVCFTDDDCVAQEGWLASLLAVAADVDIAQGQTLPNPEQMDQRGPFSHTITVAFEEGSYETCNVAYKRTLLERLGGFDQTFRHSHGEDVDLAWRAKESGATTAFAADAVVFHEVTRSNYRKFFKEISRRPDLVRTYRDHPGVRKMLGKGLFLRPSHPHTLAVVAAAILLAIRPMSPWSWLLGAVVGVIYAWDCRKTHPKPSQKAYWLAVVPASLVAELYEIALMVGASFRYRILFI